MLKSITLENFFSFAEPTKIELNEDINVLVGINASGKSNFLKALELLYEAVAGVGLSKVFLTNWGGFDSVANYSQKKDYIKLTYEFNASFFKKTKGFTFQSDVIYEITINKLGLAGYSLKEKLYNHSNKKFEEPFMYLDIESSKGQISTKEKKTSPATLQYYSPDNQNAQFKTTELVIRQLSDPDRYYPQYTFKSAIENISIYGYFDTGKESDIRKPTPSSIEDRLNSNGLNIASFLNKLKNYYSLEYEKIEKKIEQVNSNFKEIVFDLHGPNYILGLREKNLNRSVLVSNLSDGTLRFLLQMAIYHNPNKGSLISLDEPEIGLHPDMISTICDSIIETSENTQYFIATHSPLILNGFRQEHILIFDKDENNHTVVKYLNKEKYEGIPLGQLWMSGNIGGVRW